MIFLVIESNRIRKANIQKMRSATIKKTAGEEFPTQRSPSMSQDDRDRHKQALAGQPTVRSQAARNLSLVTGARQGAMGMKKRGKIKPAFMMLQQAKMKMKTRQSDTKGIAGKNRFLP